MTVGRCTLPASPSVLIVFVTRSGIDASRFSPSALSFMKPEMILRCEKSVVHRASTSSSPDQPRPAISALSSVHIAAVNTSPTGTSRAPGDEINSCTSTISLL